MRSTPAAVATAVVAEAFAAPFTLNPVANPPVMVDETATPGWAGTELFTNVG